MKKVIVIGGGLGGLTGAILLASKGFQVQLFERNQTLGGKMNRFISKEYTFDTGPSIITMPFILDHFFESIHQKMDLRLAPVTPLCRYFYPDGIQFDAYSEPEQMKESIQLFAPHELDAYKKFLTYSKNIYDLTSDIFLINPIHELHKILNWNTFKSLLQIHKIDPFRTVHQTVTKYFQDPHLIQYFDRYPTYNGSSPYLAPATLNIIPYVEHAFGGYYIQGGLYSLIERLQQIAVESGVEIHLNQPVDKILYNNYQITGIQSGSEKINADYILCNQDVVTTYNNLIDGFESYTQKLNQLEPSISGLVFFWNVNKTHNQLQQHNILFSKKYELEFQQIFKEKTAAEDPTVYIAITSKRDADHAPEGCENWFVLVNMPGLHNGQNWDTIINHTRQTVIKKLKSIDIDIENSIMNETMMTPEKFLSEYKSNAGSIYGIASNSKESAFKRPPNRSRQLKGLYFAGGSTHPGGGVPLVMLSGQIAANLITEHTKKRK